MERASEEPIILRMEDESCENSSTTKKTIIEHEFNKSNNTETIESELLSKRQLKKIRKKEKWLERKGEKRLRERTKAKEKRAHARANNIDLGPSRKALKKCTMAESSCKVTITIDMSFDDLMQDKDVAKLIKQILRCYTLNRRAISPVQFSLTGFSGKSKQEMQKHNGYEHWDVKFYPDSYLKMYNDKKIVYLTSESENVVDTLEPDCVYVIGGLVDHNSHKGYCHKLAIQEKVRHARLPLDKFLKMKARKVLTVDHVFEILLRVTEGKTWQEAFLQVLPERKNAQPVIPAKSHFPEDSLDCKSTLNHDDVKVTGETMNKTEMEEDKGA
ncbi:tRNA methyltransferase 10 homolog A [Venturia canescens]|uniref:tRNA methyltransferase 10 homolog A n=1 Tax=Venturia canescens TaxID=32260 RepID=UPI001C9D251E|nr:tRNA methyltransferase 10 homolog A [Venturia canescens]